MAAKNVSLTSNAAHIPSGWKNDIIKAIRFQMVVQKAINTSWNWDKSLGQTIHVPRTVNWEKQVKIPDTNITATSYKPTEELLFINEFDYAARFLEDFAELFIDDAITKDITESMSYALNKGVELSITNEFQNFSQTVPGTAYGVELSWANLTEANRMLQSAGIDVDAGNVTFIQSPEQMAVFKQDVNFMDSNLGGNPSEYDKSTMVRSKILGATVMFSNLLRSGGPNGGHDMAMLYKDAIWLVYAQKPTWFEDYVGFGLGTLAGFKQAYGKKRSFRHVETAGSSALTDNWAVHLPGV